MTTLTDHPMTYVWCSNCIAVKPLIVDYLPADRLNGHAVMDFVCAECRFVIATLHETDQ